MNRKSYHRTTIILSLLILLCSSCGTKSKPVPGFEEYLKSFPAVTGDLSWEQIYRADYHHPHDSFWITDSTFVEPMLKPASEDIHGYRIYGCGLERQGDYYVAFLSRDRDSKFYMEPQDFDEIIAVYSPEGQLVDWQTVATDGTAFHAEIEHFSADPFELTVEQSSLQDMNMLDAPGDLVYDVVTKRYSISAKGEIICEVIGEPRIATEARANAASSDATFNDLLKLFPVWNKKDVTAEILDLPDNGVNNNQIDGELVRTFAPGAVDDCNCGSRGMWWRSGYRINCEGFLILLITLDCDNPLKERCQYADNMILTFTPDGRQIDCTTLYRAGDYYEHRFIKGELNPFTLVIEQTVIDGDLTDKSNQTVTTTVNTFKVDNQGKIHQSQE